MFFVFYNSGILRLQPISAHGILDELPLHGETNRDTYGQFTVQSQLHPTLCNLKGNSSHATLKGRTFIVDTN